MIIDKMKTIRAPFKDGIIMVENKEVKVQDGMAEVDDDVANRLSKSGLDYRVSEETSFNDDNMLKSHKDKVSIIIPVWNQYKYTEECLKSINKNSGDVNYEIIVVDNGSSDGTYEKLIDLSKEWIKLKIIRNKENCGYSKACNQGAVVASGTYLMFLNNDVIVGKNWLGKLLTGIKKNTRIGIVGVSGGRIKIEDNRCLMEDSPIFDDKGHHYIENWCMLISKKVFEKVNGFNGNFGHGYFEEADLSLKVKQMGYVTKIISYVNIMHIGSKTMNSQTLNGFEKLFDKNSKELYSRHQEYLEHLEYS